MKNGNFFIIENDIFDFKLSPIVFYVYCYLQRCQNPAMGCYPSKKTIALACGISVSSVSRAIAELDRLGIVKRQLNYRDKRQINNSYTLPTLSSIKVAPAPDMDSGVLPERWDTTRRIQQDSG